MSKFYRINEEDLEVLEQQLPQLLDATNWEVYNQRPDLREAWEMVKSIISNVRWDYGPPMSVERIENEPTE